MTPKPATSQRSTAILKLIEGRLESWRQNAADDATADPWSTRAACSKAIVKELETIIRRAKAGRD